MKGNTVKLIGGILLGGAATLVILAACGGSTGGAVLAPPATPQATATRQPTPTSVPAATATPVPTPTPSVVPPSTAVPTPTVGAGSGDLLAQGKLIFEKTAGGIGCAYCHGLDGRGKGPANVNAANIRGKNEGDVRTAIQGGVPPMTFIKLSDEEITAVVAYLQYLNEQM